MQRKITFAHFLDIQNTSCGEKMILSGGPHNILCFSYSEQLPLTSIIVLEWIWIWDPLILFKDYKKAF